MNLEIFYLREIYSSGTQQHKSGAWEQGGGTSGQMSAQTLAALAETEVAIGQGAVTVSGTG